ncbi:protein NRT1/ PTR FAMILY 1.2-like [Senna tora]|uniref:Protein NRT1/ PTR FAMILY 1.2-like n=1 Tax=Senna tora TaxID=362788 RepID=A0A834XDM7_9FABA|nr:protein NRT1/ PTR FAMILY 1.2-like [Senna tora]
MEASSDERGRRKGGLITMPFIIGNEGFAKVASTGLLPNMVLYLIGVYKLRLGKAANIIFLWYAASNFSPLFGAFVADSFLGRFLSIALGSIITFLGTALLWLTAMKPELRPSQSSATTSQMAFLLTSLALISIGIGGISCSLPFGADQLNNKSNPNNQRVLESFIGCLFTGFAQVIVVAYKNRKLSLPPRNSAGNYHRRKGSDLLVPTNKLRFLNKACIIKNPEQDITPDGSASNPWNLCTTDQVEELKAIIKVLPLWSTSIMMSVSTSQTSFRVLQAKTMNRHITPNFQIPPGSFSSFMMFSIFVTVGIYDRIALPLASRIAHKQVRISAKTRIGIGLVFCVLDFIASALIENKRRKKAIGEGFAENPNGVVDMSAMWLLVHHALMGMGEAFNAIGQSEFYYAEFPRTMSSIGSALYSLGMGVGNLMASVIVNVVDGVSSRGGRESWVSDNLNKGRYDLYFWVLAGIESEFCVLFSL